jgi:MYXO-CTERM domain-containing protein
MSGWKKGSSGKRPPEPAGHSPALVWLSLVGLLASRRRPLGGRMVDEELADSLPAGSDEGKGGGS